MRSSYEFTMSCPFKSIDDDNNKSKFMGALLVMEPGEIQLTFLYSYILHIGRTVEYDVTIH